MTAPPSFPWIELKILDKTAKAMSVPMRKSQGSRGETGKDLAAAKGSLSVPFVDFVTLINSLLYIYLKKSMFPF